MNAVAFVTDDGASAGISAFSNSVGIASRRSLTPRGRCAGLSPLVAFFARGGGRTRCGMRETVDLVDTDAFSLAASLSPEALEVLLAERLNSSSNISVLLTIESSLSPSTIGPRALYTYCLLKIKVMKNE